MPSSSSSFTATSNCNSSSLCMSRMLLLLFTLCSTFLMQPGYSGACHNNCNRNGHCSHWGTCECFQGWTGNDCSQRICPSGRRFVDIPSATDTAHATEVCSGQGVCNVVTGLCKCEDGFGGANCEQLLCNNNCNGHGACLSLARAASTEDGYLYNRTTTYTVWDANMIHGCKCDPGWSGYDCSQRVCESAIDPRMGTEAGANKKEVVTLVCTCPGTPNLSEGCLGRFKLRMYGIPTDSWLTPFTTASELANTLMSAGQRFNKAAAHSINPVTVATDGWNNYICELGATSTTTITFNRQQGDVPAISMYANLFTRGTIAFTTTQILQCDCVSTLCTGSFVPSFDGVAHTVPIDPLTDDGTLVLAALNGLSTVTSAGLSVTCADTGTAICVSGAVTNHSFVFTGPLGNAPTMGISSSVAIANNPTSYDTDSVAFTSTAAALRIVANPHGRNSNVKLCSGIGTCNFYNAECTCPEGWRHSADGGPCSELAPASSDYDGLQTCPGLIFAAATPARPGAYSAVTAKDLLSTQYMYMSLNHNPASYTGGRSTVSTIERFAWDPDTFSPLLNAYWNHGDGVLVNLTSSDSAGPIAIDKVTNRLYFMDNNVASPFLGYLVLNNTDSNANAPGPIAAGEYITVFSVTGVVSGLAIDTHYKRRRLYWSVPGTVGAADGALFYTVLDEDTLTAYSLVNTIGQANLISPTALSIHYLERRLYWLDVSSASSTTATVLKRVNLASDGVAATYASKNTNSDYDGYELYRVYDVVDGETVSTDSSSGMVILFEANNTVVFADTNAGSLKIIGANLDAPTNYTATIDESAADRETFQGLLRSQIIVNSTQAPAGLGTPRYFSYDAHRKLLVWSDPTTKTISIARYPYRIDYSRSQDPLSFRTIYTSPDALAHPLSVDVANDIFPKIPVGIYLDKGSISTLWGSAGRTDLAGVEASELPPITLECYGLGSCGGLAKNWVCECNADQYGNCLAKECPKGLAWFNKQTVDDVAHDVFVECSGMGLCNHISGQCECKAGFEGAACERSSCPGGSLVNPEDNGGAAIPSIPCNNNGRCLPVATMARYAKNGDLDYFSPPHELPSSNSVVYGSNPRDPVTWDAWRFQGCIADDYGYYPTTAAVNGANSATGSTAASHDSNHNITSATGYKLSKKQCPYTYNYAALLNSLHSSDNITANNYTNTVQSLQCIATSGSFTLSFRGAESVAVDAATAVLGDMEFILQSMATIGLVHVTTSDSTAHNNNTVLCAGTAATAPVVFVSFLTEHGALPLIKLDPKSTSTANPNVLSGGTPTSTVAIALVFEHPNTDTVGNTLLVECGGHGECNPDSGECVCWKHWGSSDGVSGALGNSGDCGYNRIV